MKLNLKTAAAAAGVAAVAAYLLFFYKPKQVTAAQPSADAKTITEQPPKATPNYPQDTVSTSTPKPLVESQYAPNVSPRSAITGQTAVERFGTPVGVTDQATLNAIQKEGSLYGGYVPQYAVTYEQPVAVKGGSGGGTYGAKPM